MLLNFDIVVITIIWLVMLIVIDMLLSTFLGLISADQHANIMHFGFFCRAKASGLIKITNDPLVPQSISIAIFAKQVCIYVYLVC